MAEYIGSDTPIFWEVLGDLAPAMTGVPHAAMMDVRPALPPVSTDTGSNIKLRRPRKPPIKVRARRTDKEAGHGT